MPAESLELWRRNPVDCIKELFGNPAFKNVMRYAPERHYADQEAKIRVYDEMWTADWWWERQVRRSITRLLRKIYLLYK
jgi:Plavaka transposase